MSVSLFYRAKAIAQEAKEEKIKDMTPDKIRSFLDKFKENIEEEVKKAKTELESKNRKP